MENSLIMILSLEPDHKLLALVEKIRFCITSTCRSWMMAVGLLSACLSALAQQFGCQVLTHPKNQERRSHQNRSH